MPPRKRTEIPQSKTRINVCCSTQQKVMFERAAKRIDCDVSTMMIAYTVKGIGVLGAADGEVESDLPVVVNGKLGASLRAAAAAQGVPVDRMLELLLVAEGG